MKEQIKKVVFAALVAAVSIAAQAAYLRWQVKGVSSTDDKPMSDSNLYRVYIFQNDVVSTISQKIESKDFDSVRSSVLRQTAQQSSYEMITGTSKDGNFETSAYGIWSGAITVCALIINADSLEEASQYMFAKVANGGYNSNDYMLRTQPSSTDGNLYPSFGDQSKSGATWLTIPEPTSGLLLVLGAATLALKRRRV